MEGAETIPVWLSCRDCHQWRSSAVQADTVFWPDFLKIRMELQPYQLTATDRSFTHPVRTPADDVFPSPPQGQHRRETVAFNGPKAFPPSLYADAGLIRPPFHVTPGGVFVCLLISRGSCVSLCPIHEEQVPHFTCVLRLCCGYGWFLQVNSARMERKGRSGHLLCFSFFRQDL